MRGGLLWGLPAGAVFALEGLSPVPAKPALRRRATADMLWRELQAMGQRLDPASGRIAKWATSGAKTRENEAEGGRSGEARRRRR